MNKFKTYRKELQFCTILNEGYYHFHSTAGALMLCTITFLLNFVEEAMELLHKNDYEICFLELLRIYTFCNLGVNRLIFFIIIIYLLIVYIHIFISLISNNGLDISQRGRNQSFHNARVTPSFELLQKVFSYLPNFPRHLSRSWLY